MRPHQNFETTLIIKTVHLNITVAHNCHGKTKNLTAKPKTSRQKQNTSLQNQKPHGKNKNLTAKPKTSRQNQKPHGKNKIPHGKTENLTVKTKTSRQNQKPHGKTKYFTAKAK